MEFEFSGSLYVEPADFKAMLDLCRIGTPFHTAVSIVSAGWDDADYYLVDFVMDDICQALREAIN